MPFRAFLFFFFLPMASSSPSSFLDSGSKNHGVSFLVMSFGSLLFSVFGFQGTNSLAAVSYSAVLSAIKNQNYLNFSF